MRVAVIVPAAGSGTRFGGDKLAQDLGGRPVLLRSVEAFSKRPDVGRVVVAAPPDDVDAFRDRFGAQLGFHGASIVPGGRTERWESVRAALEAIDDDQTTHVAVHDGARPLASAELLDRVFAAAAIHPAVVPVVPVRDTLRRVGTETVAAAEDDALVDSILGAVDATDVGSARPLRELVDRTDVVAVQTPQTFRIDLLRRAYAQTGLDGATDDATLVERLGEVVVAVDGDPRNLKITAPGDLEIARALLRMF